MQELDRVYRDRRGIEVHVIGYEREKRRVIFMRKGYPHLCAQPLKWFKEKFDRVDTCELKDAGSLSQTTYAAIKTA